MSRLHAPSVTTDSAATATARCFIMRMCMSPSSEREPRAQRPGARDWVSTEVEAAIGGCRLHRADAAGVGAEEIDLGIVAAVIGPDVEIAAREGEIDTIAEVAPNDGRVDGVARRQLAELHERAVLDPVLEDALGARVEPRRQLARVAVRQQLTLVRVGIAGDARVLRARREIHDLVAEHAVEEHAEAEAAHQ